MTENSELIAELRKQIATRDDQMLSALTDLEKLRKIQRLLLDVIPEFDAHYAGDAAQGVEVMIALIRNMALTIKQLNAENARLKDKLSKC